MHRACVHPSVRLSVRSVKLETAYTQSGSPEEAAEHADSVSVADRGTTACTEVFIVRKRVQKHSPGGASSEMRLRDW